MLSKRCDNNSLKHLQERCLCLIYNDKRSLYENLSTDDRSVSIHQKSIQDVVIEMFKVKNSLAPKIINDLFDNDTEDHDNLRHRTEFRISLVNSVYHGSKSISCLGPKNLGYCSFRV